MEANANIQSLMYDGIWVLGGSVYTQAPEQGELRGMLFIFYHAPALIQLAFLTYPTAKIYYRAYWNGTWQNWVQV